MSDSSVNYEWLQGLKVGGRVCDCRYSHQKIARKDKGKPSLFRYSGDGQHEACLLPWRVWAQLNPELIDELRTRVEKHLLTLTDRFAKTPINQARALADSLNEESNEGLSR